MWALSLCSRLQRTRPSYSHRVKCVSRPVPLSDSGSEKERKDVGETPEKVPEDGGLPFGGSDSPTPFPTPKTPLTTGAKRGPRVPWNRGKKLPKLLRDKIKARTIEAHRRPDVVLRVLKRDQRPEAEPLPKVQIVGSAGPLEFSIQDLKRMKWSWDAGKAQPSNGQNNNFDTEGASSPRRTHSARKKRGKIKPVTRPPPEVFYFEPVEMTGTVIRRMAHDVKHKLSDFAYLDAYEGKVLPKNRAGRVNL